REGGPRPGRSLLVRSRPMPQNVHRVSLRSVRRWCENGHFSAILVRNGKINRWHVACLSRAMTLQSAPDESTQGRARGVKRAATARRARERAVSLVELMTVVISVGILATLATYGVRKYGLEAKKAEASSMLVQIRAAEEAYKDETFEYLGGEDFSVWYPTD